MRAWQVGILAGAMTMTLNAAAQRAEKPVRVSNSFQFAAQAPMEVAAPLFGPEGERCWAGEHWDPQFVYPQPAHDEQGVVFTVQHGDHNSVWVNTVFDLKAGRMQYVMVVPEKFVSVIDVRLIPEGAAATKVDVSYLRTALDPSLNEAVIAMGDKDRASGEEWKRSIESCLALKKQKP
jgi:hypothetical protein